MASSSNGTQRRVSDRQFAGLLVGGLLLIVTVGLVVTDAVRDAAAERSDLRLYSLPDVVGILIDEAPSGA